MVTVHPEYVFDEQHNRKAMLLPVEEWKRLLATSRSSTISVRMMLRSSTVPSEFRSSKPCAKSGTTTRRFAIDPRPSGCVKLSGRAAGRIRVGSCRAIYEVHGKDFWFSWSVLDTGGTYIGEQTNPSTKLKSYAVGPVDEIFGTD